MDAPVYLPSKAYEPPAYVHYVMSTKRSSITALLANPATKAILVKNIPNFEGLISNEMLKPHLENFSPRDLVLFGMFKSDVLDKVDEEIKTLPKAQGGAQ